MKKLARYACQRCFAQYVDLPGPTQCPACNHHYIKWINYDEFDLVKKKDSSSLVRLLV